MGIITNFRVPIIADLRACIWKADGDYFIIAEGNWQAWIKKICILQLLVLMDLGRILPINDMDFIIH